MDLFGIILLTLIAFAGMLYGTISGGGTLITIPAMILLGMPVQIAIGTNRFVVAASTIIRLPIFFKHIKTIGLIVVAMLVLHSIGAAIGANIVFSLDEGLLLNLVAVLLIVASLVIFFNKKMGLEHKHELSKTDKIILNIALFFTGIYRGFFGPGLGTIIRIILPFMGYSFLQSIALASYLSFFSSIAALFFFVIYNLVDYSVAVPMAIGGTLGSYISSKHVVKKGNPWVKKVFVVLVIIMALKLLFFR